METAAPPAVCIEVTADLIARFAALTGDRSSLHVDDSFARRSAYRRPVAHGMLPVAFLAATAPFNVSGQRCVLKSIEGRFLAPVFAGDRLRLTVSTVRPRQEEGQVESSFEIQHADSGAVATRGVVTLEYEPDEPRGEHETAGFGAMVADALEVAHARFEDIAVGAEDVTDFGVSAATMRDFAALLRAGTSTDRGASAAQDSFTPDLPNLLAVLLFSTSVGVRLPGGTATFLEFTARFERDVRLNAPHRLRARVTHKSASTRIVKKEMLIVALDRPDVAVAQGKVATLVARPVVTMPSSEELKPAADWGLRDRVILVTGASRGIGETTAKLLGVLGARVVVNYHRGADDAKRVVDEIIAAGGEAMAVAADVSDRAQVRCLVQQVRERFGSVDVLVNNAARDYRPIPFLELGWDEVQKDIDVIVKGAVFCCQEVIPLMLERGGGRIVNISTVATDDPPPDQAKYVIAKSALVGLTRSLSIEFAARNIQVNMVAPSFVETDFVTHIQDGFRKKIAQDTPMRRHATPIDVARAVAFLASPLSSFTTGQKLMVTGGGAPYA